MAQSSEHIISLKVHIFWEDHKIVQNLPLTFDLNSKGKISQNFVAFSEYMNFKKLDSFEGSC